MIFHSVSSWLMQSKAGRSGINARDKNLHPRSKLESIFGIESLETKLKVPWQVEKNFMSVSFWVVVNVVVVVVVVVVVDVFLIFVFPGFAINCWNRIVLSQNLKLRFRCWSFYIFFQSKRRARGNQSKDRLIWSH